jgi:hypothetical protein
MENFWKAWDMEQAIIAPLRKGGFKFNLSQLPDGNYSLDVSAQPLRDISFLKDLPIEELILFNTSVSDLRPVTNLPLTHLDIRMTKVTDLRPLRAPALSAGLRELDLWQVPATDFSPIAACTNLESIDAAGTAMTNLNVVRGRKLHVALLSYAKITDVSALAGMPLERVTLAGTAVTDLRPLLQCPTLVELVLPSGARDVSALRSLPRLTRLSFEEDGGLSKQAASDFWLEYGHGGITAETISILSENSIKAPHDSLLALRVATLQTWLGQDGDYEATRRRLVQQAEDTDQAPTAERAAKAGCLRPSTNAVLLAKILHIAQRAVELGKNDPSLPWFQLGLGLAEYRNGQYATAEQTLSTAEQTASDNHNLSVDNRNEIQGTARLFRAMSLSRQNEPEEARKLFSQAAAQMPPLPKGEGKPLGPADHDTIICWIAYKEAKALIEGPTVPLVEPSQPK